MNANTISLTSAALRRAADLNDEIAAKQAELDEILQGKVVNATPSAEHPAPNGEVHVTASGRRFSPEAIEKIRAAQRRRWKLVRKAAKAAAVQAAPTATPAAPVTPPVAEPVTA